MRTLMAATAALFVLAGCRTATVESEPGAPAPPPAGMTNLLPAGSEVVVELDETLTTRDARVGDRFTTTVEEAVMNAGGQVIVPEGAKVEGTITGIDDSDRVGDQAALRLNFDRLIVNGNTYAFSADVTDVDVDIEDRARIGEVQEKAGVGAAAGAVLGAIIGGDLRDILVGGVLGAGAGTIISLGLGDVEAALPAGSDLTLRTKTATTF